MAGTQRPLAQQLHLRISRFGEAFSQIVAAQFWIATFNTVFTAIFLLGVLPLTDLHLPYTPALITLTFVAGGATLLVDKLPDPVALPLIVIIALASIWAAIRFAWSSFPMARATPIWSSSTAPPTTLRI